MKYLKSFLRIVITVAVLAFIAKFAMQKYDEYFTNPWTRDAQVRSYVVEIAPMVGGAVTAVHVKDNELVKKGDLLFEIDDRKYKIKVAKLKADIKRERANLRGTKIEYDRVRAIAKKDSGAVSQKDLIRREVAYNKSLARIESLNEQLNAAKLNLEWTKIYAPIDGYISNINFQVGSQAVANRPMLALVDVNSFWVYAFFRETMIKDIDVKEKAKVILMAYKDQPLDAEVESIGWGISPNDGNPGQNLLPKVRPVFQWIRLAQRIPVRIKILNKPENIKLRVGMTASVTITTPKGNK